MANSDAANVAQSVLDSEGSNKTLGELVSSMLNTSARSGDKTAALMTFQAPASNSTTGGSTGAAPTNVTVNNSVDSKKGGGSSGLDPSKILDKTPEEEGAAVNTAPATEVGDAGAASLGEAGGTSAAEAAAAAEAEAAAAAAAEAVAAEEAGSMAIAALAVI